jgi:dihydrofolate synthase/folylpolyglutamate synthase
VHWGLERTRNALAELGDPHLSYPTVHVGGTNGKGSVVSTVAAALDEAGLRAGCYTSPHLCSFRERFVVAERALSEETLQARADEIRDVVVEHRLTFFEAVTVLAFYAFAREEVDVVVAEVGLGGRLDATNVLRPLVAAVTNVAMDHADFLGDTLPRIAREKAGIIKADIPFVTAVDDPDLLELFRGICAHRGAREMITVDPARDVRELEVARDHTAFTLATRAWGELRVRTPLVGRHQAVNAALAVEIMEHLPDELRPDADAVLRGIARVRYPGRDQIELLDGRTWLFDVAHNTAGIQSLVDTLDRVALPGPTVALVAVLGDKDWRSMLPPLLSRVDGAVFTQAPSSPPERRWDPAAALSSVAPGLPVRIEGDFVIALEGAARDAADGTVVVTGSCHTVGSALKVLGMEPLRSS